MQSVSRHLTRSPQAMLESFHWFRGEGFRLIVEDLVGVQSESEVIVEGIRLLPDLVKPLLEDTRRAVWRLPTPEFRSAAFDKRDIGSDFVRQTSDPDRAPQNLLERDRMFTDRLRADPHRADLNVIEVDTSMSEDELTAAVLQSLGL